VEGWISLYRKFINWQWYQDINVKTLFIHLLLTANHKENKWKNILVKRGELITSVAHLSEETGLSIKQVRNCLKKLTTSQELTIKTTNKFTLINIVNYSKYQDKNEEKDNLKDKQRANEGQSKDKQRATNNNDNNVNNDKNSIHTMQKEVKEICDKYGIPCTIREGDGK
jgi:hypothetical protein